MSTPITKRPGDAGSRGSPNGTGSPSRGVRTPTSQAGAGVGATTPGSVARTRSIRSSTLVSGRAGAVGGTHRRESSRLSMATSADAAAATEAQEAARAETVALLDDLRERLSRAEGQAEQFRRQAEVQQRRLDEAQREQARLEERVHELDEHVEGLRGEKREMGRQMQQMETIYEAEHSAMTREKEDMANREEEMQMVIQRLKDSLAQRNGGDEEGRPSRQTNNSPSLEGFAPPSSLHRSDSRNNSKLLLQKDKLIESLRLELAEAQIKLVESENQGGGRLHEVERQLLEARVANARLMEDNEGYQLLLQEKTLKGDFGAADFLHGLGVDIDAALPLSSAAPPSRPRSAHQDALAALEGRGSTLADELSGVAETDSESESESGAPATPTTAAIETQRRLEAELKALQDQNKAMSLYINKIIERLLEHKDYQYILDKSSDGRQPAPAAAAAAAAAATTATTSLNAVPSPTGNTNKELPPPPGSAAAAQPGSIQNFLQRTKSMAVGGSHASRSRQRPVSVMVESALSHPDTAPSIPLSLSRSTSVRRGRPMSEQFTGGGGAPSAASVVNAMYKGPDGPLSPSSFRNSGYYFGTAGAGGASAAAAAAAAAAGGGSMGPPSGSGQRSPGLPSSGNFPGMRSETSSVSGDGTGGASTSTGSDASTAPSHHSQSPPRQHEKTAFTGSKPRPLRLVQERTDNARPADAPPNRRASWMGWASWGKKDDGSGVSPVVTTLPVAEPIQE